MRCDAPLDGPVSPTTRQLLDVLLFSSVAAAGVAASLTLAADAALRPPSASSGGAVPAALAFTGTLVVYNVDRLRDLGRDRARWPERSHFIARHRSALVWLTAAAALACLPLATTLRPAAWWSCAAAGVLGLGHRRLKGRTGVEVGYVTLAWIAVVVGLPAAQRGVTRLEPEVVAATAAVLGATIAANLLVSGTAALPHPGPRLPWARTLALAAGALALVGPGAVRALAWIPALELVALWRYRASERYGLGWLDGALLAGAILARVCS